MNAFQMYIKSLLENNLIDRGNPKKPPEDNFNDVIFTATKQGYLKDVTPRDIIMQKDQEVGAVVLLDGVKYFINIFNPPDLMNPDNKYNYKVESGRLLIQNG